jgi:phenylpropionate dioxygenase-like ring-hydroxylating dioxygenase large terminal subunit
MQDLKAELLRGLWYVALLGADLRPGRMVAKTLLGERLLIGRGRGSQIFALRDCPSSKFLRQRAVQIKGGSGSSG